MTSAKGDFMKRIVWLTGLFLLGFTAFAQVPEFDAVIQFIGNPLPSKTTRIAANHYRSQDRKHVFRVDGEIVTGVYILGPSGSASQEQIGTWITSLNLKDNPVWVVDSGRNSLSENHKYWVNGDYMAFYDVMASTALLMRREAGEMGAKMFTNLRLIATPVQNHWFLITEPIFFQEIVNKASTERQAYGW